MEKLKNKWNLICNNGCVYLELQRFCNKSVELEWHQRLYAEGDCSVCPDNVVDDMEFSEIYLFFTVCYALQSMLFMIANKYSTAENVIVL